MKSSLQNMVLILFAITLVAGAAVSVVYKVTKDPIEKAKEAKMVAALKVVLPEFNNNPVEECQRVSISGDSVTVYTAKKDGQTVGYAVEVDTKEGFGGVMRLMVGFEPGGSIYCVEALEHSETPGLGDKIESQKSCFSVQFQGKNPAEFKLLVKKDGGHVDAITASTISSRAYTGAIQKAYDAVITLNKEGGENE